MSGYIHNSLAATAPLRLEREKQSYSLAGHLEIIRDRKGTFTIGDISSLNFDSRFQKISSRAYYHMRGDAVAWLRFSLKDSQFFMNKETENPWFLKFDWPFIHKINFYISDETGTYLVKKTGLFHTWNKKYGLDKLIAIKIPELTSETVTVYVRIEILEIVPIALEICTMNKLITQARLTSLVQGIFYGILIAMILYNLALWVSLGQSAYIWYVLSGLFSGIYFTGFNGLAYQFWPNLLGPWFYPPLLFCWLSISSIFLILFTRSFLYTKSNVPRIDKVLLTFMAAWFIGIILAFTSNASVSIVYFTFVGMFFSITILVTAVVCRLNKFKPAMMFLVAWGCSCIGGIWLALTMSGIVMYSTFGFYGLQIGTALEMILFSLALSQRIGALQREKDSNRRSKIHYKLLSYKDGLTDLFNKRWLLENLEEEVRRASKTNIPVSVAMFDVDNFKNYNDTYGHPAGDDVLIYLAGVMKSCLRKGDNACRFGGEEFTVILPGARTQGALEVTERIRKKMERQIFHPLDNRNVHVTVSIGIAHLLPGEGMSGLLNRADQALYAAKNGGKNQSVAAP